MCDCQARPGAYVENNLVSLSAHQKPLPPAADPFPLTPVRFCVLLCCCVPQRQSELQLLRSSASASVDAEQSRLLGLVSAQAAALADKERQLEVNMGGDAHGIGGLSVD